MQYEMWYFIHITFFIKGFVWFGIICDRSLKYIFEIICVYLSYDWRIPCITIIVLDPLNVLHSMHWENYVSISFNIEWDIIVVTVFLLILNQMEFHLVQNRKENCHHDHIPFNVKGNGNVVLPVGGLQTRKCF